MLNVFRCLPSHVMNFHFIFHRMSPVFHTFSSKNNFFSFSLSLLNQQTTEYDYCFPWLNTLETSCSRIWFLFLSFCSFRSFFCIFLSVFRFDRSRNDIRILAYTLALCPGHTHTHTRIFSWLFGKALGHQLYVFLGDQKPESLSIANFCCLISQLSDF